MEFQSLELTEEDILTLHRQYITKLYNEDKKTAIEITQILHEHRLSVSVSQIHTCLQNWNLIPITPSRLDVSPGFSSYTTSSLSRQNAELYSSTPRSFTGCHASLLEEYRNRSLPSIPACKQKPASKSGLVGEDSPTLPTETKIGIKTTRDQVKGAGGQGNGNITTGSLLNQNSLERLKLTCHHHPMPINPDTSSSPLPTLSTTTTKTTPTQTQPTEIQPDLDEDLDLITVTRTPRAGDRGGVRVRKAISMGRHVKQESKKKRGGGKS